MCALVGINLDHTYSAVLPRRFCDLVLRGPCVLHILNLS